MTDLNNLTTRHRRYLKPLHPEHATRQAGAHDMGGTGNATTTGGTGVTRAHVGENSEHNCGHEEEHNQGTKTSVDKSTVLPDDNTLEMADLEFEHSVPTEEKAS